MKEKGTVFVGMSGGVDSSVTAYLLQQQGYDVVGVFIKVWHPDFLTCHWEQERLDAMRVAATLHIPFLTCNAEEAYKREVADYFISAYQAGHTPNPDVMCNTFVKFGVFHDFARTHGAHAIATGHYAKIIYQNQEPIICRGKDVEKDQSYFLWNITPAVRKDILFPLADLTKGEVRRIAQRAHLPTATKDESQGICFLGHVDIPQFLSHYIPLVEGVVLDEQGKEVGRHHGAAIYTIGQRHGFALLHPSAHAQPAYVVAKDIPTNTITVSSQKPLTGTTHGSTILVRGAREPYARTREEFHAQIRYRQHPFPVTVLEEANGILRVKISEAVDLPTEGQSCVLYDGDMIAGGGIIEAITT